MTLQVLASWAAALVDKAHCLATTAGASRPCGPQGRVFSASAEAQLSLAALLPNLRNIEHIVLAVHFTFVKPILPSHVAATAEACG